MQHQVRLLNSKMDKQHLMSKVEICYCLYTDDKACTFVGTAAYVPPEVLNSSPATVG